MKSFKNFNIYIPEEKEKKEIVESGLGITFLKSTSGIDWYDCQKYFSPSTVKVSFDDSGIIRQVSQDISSLFPMNMSVAEVDASGVPDDVSANGKWFFDGKKITAYQPTQSELIAQADATKSSLMTAANEMIAPLQDAVDLGMATDEEVAQLTAWKQYRVLLNRVDTSTAPDILWPEIPASS